METQAVCGMCLAQLAQYTCPRCNLRYCSLACYRAEGHGTCAETFYKATLVEELQQKKADPEERQRMIDMLRRLEEEAPDVDGDEDGDDGDDDDDDVNALRTRLSEADLEELDAEAIWERLTPKERTEFERLVASGKAAALVPPWKPWWEDAANVPSGPPRIVEVGDRSSTDADGSPPPPPPRPKPTLPEVPRAIPSLRTLTKNPPNPALRYNLLDLLLVYTLMQRLYDGDAGGHAAEVAAAVLEISRVLATRDAFAYSDVPDALARVRYTLAQDRRWAPVPFDRLVADVVALLQHRAWILAAIGDLQRWFAKRAGPARSADAAAAAAAAYRKLDFYLSWIDAQPADTWAVLATALVHTATADAASSAASSARTAPSPGPRPRIIEL